MFKHKKFFQIFFWDAAKMFPIKNLWKNVKIFKKLWMLWRWKGLWLGCSGKVSQSNILMESKAVALRSGDEHSCVHTLMESDLSRKQENAKFQPQIHLLLFCQWKSTQSSSRLGITHALAVPCPHTWNTHSSASLKESAQIGHLFWGRITSPLHLHLHSIFMNYNHMMLLLLSYLYICVSLLPTTLSAWGSQGGKESLLKASSACVSFENNNTLWGSHIVDHALVLCESVIALGPKPFGLEHLRIC